jgi:DNA repair exonuclease SbcCD ATPase subunit
MARKIFSGMLVVLSSILLVLSLVGIAAAWYYNKPLTEEALSRLGEVETELTRTQSALQDAKEELERTLRIVDSAEETLARVTDELAQAKQLFEEFDRTLGDRLIPGLENSKERLNSVRQTLEDLRSGLAQLNALPLINLNLPGDEMLLNLIQTVNSIDGQIDRMHELADQASTFAEDVSFLMGGDFSETRQRLETFLEVIGDYEQKVGGWHAQVQNWIVLLPVWIDRASFLLTIFLLWFGFSQFVLLLYGLVLWRGGDPLLALRREPVLPLDARDAQAAMLAELDEVVDDLEEVAEELEETAEELEEKDKGEDDQDVLK